MVYHSLPPISFLSLPSNLLHCCLEGRERDFLESGARGEGWESEEKSDSKVKNENSFFFKSLDFFSLWAFLAFEFVTFTACWWHVCVRRYLLLEWLSVLDDLMWLNLSLKLIKIISIVSNWFQRGHLPSPMYKNNFKVRPFISCYRQFLILVTSVCDEGLQLRVPFSI